ncbi:intraflagellar transport protein 20 homolog isoform X1 [Petaurus breviceps papuanus]|uniref:intraflagellar transport protein 20 homolog isoform X1 n=1 Tax=Petaurus breviceps papuanus TaxID=3040969 RepID=UPI0036DEFCDB
MAKDILGDAGLHFDELNKLRVLDPEVTQQTIELKEECKDFVDKIGQFQKIVGGLIELVDQLAKEAENEKMKAIGARNLLKSIAKQREAQQQQLQALIAEKKMQLERILPDCSQVAGARSCLCRSQDSRADRLWLWTLLCCHSLASSYICRHQSCFEAPTTLKGIRQ